MAIADEAGKSLLRRGRRGLLFRGTQSVRARLGRQKCLGLQRLLDLEAEQFVAGLLSLQRADRSRRIGARS